MPQPGKQRGQGSVVEILTEVLQLLTQAKLMPDAQAHMQVIQALEQGIIQYIQMVRQKSIAGAIQGGQSGGGAPGGQPPGGVGGPPGGAGGAPNGPGAPSMGMGGGAGNLGFGTPDPDELRRTLAGPAAVGG